MENILGLLKMFVLLGNTSDGSSLAYVLVMVLLAIWYHFHSKNRSGVLFRLRKKYSSKTSKKPDGSFDFTETSSTEFEL